MSKKYFLLIASFCVFITVILITRKDDTAIYKLKERSSAVTSSSEWINTKKAIESIEDEIRRNPSNYALKIKLAQAYLQEGRVTGDHSYYDALAMHLVHDVLKKEPLNFEALCCKATLEASAHRFDEALETCKIAITVNSYSAYIYGVMCDAYVELGNYKEAVTVADKMVSIRPDIRSYARVSYLREIFGDYKGAQTAMQLALNAGYPGLEQTEWVRVYLGHLFEITGDTTTAGIAYRTSLSVRNNYAPALAGEARLASLNKNYAEAVRLYSKAASVMEDYNFHVQLGELYHLSGDEKRSKESYDHALNILANHKHPQNTDDGKGHQIDRELALVYLSMKDYDKAYESAKAEYRHRPANIDVAETLAKACYGKKNYAEAEFYILKALSTGSNNAMLLAEAGAIFSKMKHPLLARQYLNKAKTVNPNGDTELTSLLNVVSGELVQQGHD